MTDQVDKLKTFKLLIGGALVASESERTIEAADRRDRVIARIGRASSKDVQSAVDAARAAQPSWAHRPAFDRARALYSLAEAVEDKREALAEAIAATGAATIAGARREVSASIDRLVCFAGWADKYAHILGGRNPVAGPYYNFTDPEPAGVVAVIAPDEPALLGLLTLLAPPLCAGNTIVALASSRHPLPAALFAEVCAAAGIPAGAVNIITGTPSELIESIALHRNIDAIGAANLRKRQAAVFRQGIAENVKRVEIERIGREQWFDADVCESPWRIEPFVQMKTIWHPSAMT